MVRNDRISIEELFDGRDSEYINRFISRFWDKVDRGSSDECWLWTGAVSSGNYGTIGFLPPEGRQRSLLVHRVSKYLQVRDDISHRQVNHTCHEELCCNPEHIYIGTPRDNNCDMVDEGNVSGQKLQQQDVIEIRERYEVEDITHAELAEDYPVQRTAITRIVNGKRWSHI